jgi:hypothetical protein
LDVEQISLVGLQRVSNVAERRAVGQDDLPVGAGAREQRPMYLWTGKRPAGLRHDAPMALGRCAEIQRLAQGDFKVVDQG